MITTSRGRRPALASRPVRPPTSRSAGTRAANTEQRIVAAAQRLLAQRGPTGFTMRDVAARVGVTVGALYKHFSGREELTRRVVEVAFADFEETMLRAMLPHAAGSFARIAALGDAYLTFAHDHPEAFKALFSSVRQGPEPLSALPGQAGYPLLRQCVVEALDSGVLRPGDPDLIACFLWSRVHGIVTLMWAVDLATLLADTGHGASPLAVGTATRAFVAEGLLT